MTEILSAELSTGTITVEVDRSVMRPEDLFGFAERHNPKRSFLFVSKVLGRHIPVRPSVMRESYAALAAGVPEDIPGPVLVTGMAETAIGLGAGVHREIAAGRDDVVFLCTTRHRMDAPLLCEFLEEHSHATDQTVHEPTDPITRAMVRNAKTLVLVDDEASTGKTFANLYSALEAAGLDQVERIYLVTLTDWSDGKAEAAIGDKAVSVSLLAGRYTWSAKEGAMLPAMRPVPPRPEVHEYQAPLREIRQDLDWGRLGVRSHHPYLYLSGMAELTPRGGKVLVVGTGEHVWQPFLLAESLEAEGLDVHYSSVTRSPIADGHAIGSGIAFADNYGIGVTNFLYNVDPEDYDDIYLCVETHDGVVDQVLVDHLSRCKGCLTILADWFQGVYAGDTAMSA